MGEIMKMEAYLKYPHHIENIETIRAYPDYFKLEHTFKERFKRFFKLQKHNEFECWVKDKSNKSWKCFINLNRIKKYPHGYVKFLGKTRRDKEKWEK